MDGYDEDNGRVEERVKGVAVREQNVISGIEYVLTFASGGLILNLRSEEDCRIMMKDGFTARLNL